MRNLKETKKRLGCNRRKRSISKENETKRSISGKNTNEQMNRFFVTISNFRKCLTGTIFVVARPNIVDNHDGIAECCR